MNDLTQLRWKKGELLDALNLTRAFDISGPCGDSRVREFVTEVSWYRGLLDADSFSKSLCDNPSPFILEEVCVPHRRDPSRVFLAGDARLSELVRHRLTLATLLRTPLLNERLQVNPHLTKLIDCFSDCDDLLTWIGEKPISVQPKMAREILSELNTALDEFRSTTSDKAFINSVTNQKRASERKRLGFTRYADKLLGKYGRLGVVRLDLGYHQNHRDSIDFEKAKRHRETYLDLRHSHQLFAQWVGYAWAVKYGPVKGYHTNLVLFFDGSVRKKDEKLALSLGELWAEKFAEDQGTYFSCSRTDIEERYHARVVDTVSIDDSRSMEGLCHTINSLTKTDDLIRLRLPGNELSFGRGKLRGTS